MSKFKVGDVIKANKESNKKYLVTNQKNGWTGKVTSEEENGLIYVKTLTPEEYKGDMYTVDERYFDLVEDSQIATHIVNKNAVIVKLDDGRKGLAELHGYLERSRNDVQRLPCVVGDRLHSESIHGRLSER